MTHEDFFWVRLLLYTMVVDTNLNRMEFAVFFFFFPPYLGHVSLRPSVRAHGPPRSSRRLRSRRRRALHGADDAAGMVVRLHHRGSNHAAVRHARKGEGQNKVRRAKGKLAKNYRTN